MNSYMSCSLSAKLQSALTTWRNPYSRQVWTRVKCELGYACLGSLAVIETVASYTLAKGSLALSCYCNRPYKALKHWHDCSKIAARWAWTNMASNIFDPNMPTTSELFIMKEKRKNLLINPLKLSGRDPLKPKKQKQKPHRQTYAFKSKPPL